MNITEKTIVWAVIQKRETPETKRTSGVLVGFIGKSASRDAEREADYDDGGPRRYVKRMTLGEYRKLVGSSVGIIAPASATWK